MNTLRVLGFGLLLLVAGCESAAPEGQRVGNACPDIVGDDVDGKTIKLSDFKGKVVLVEFWGTWCGPCQQLIPHEAKKVTQDYKGRPFVMLGIAMDNKATLKDFLATKPLPWQNIVDGQGMLAKQFNAEVVPSFILVDHEGIIRGRWFHGVTREATEVWAAVEEQVQEAEKK